MEEELNKETPRIHGRTCTRVFKLELDYIVKESFIIKKKNPHTFTVYFLTRTQANYKHDDPLPYWQY